MTACGNNQWSVSASWKMISRFSTCIVSTVHDRANQARIRISNMNTSAPSTLLINLDLYCQHSSWPPQQGKPERSWTWLQRLLHVLQTVAISLEWFLDVLAFFCHSFEAILDVSAFFLLLTKMGKKGQWVWCTLDTPDATTHLRLYLVLDKTKDLQFRKFKFLLSWTNF